ncbi:MAG: hypothetical protein AAGA03_15905 [Planctomycetota bacterium]
MSSKRDPSEEVGETRRLAVTASIAALVAWAISYLLSYVATRQSLLSVVVGALLALVVFVVCRTVQRRGQLSLAICVFGLPLVLGLAFAGFRSLQPYRENQRTIDQLRKNAISFRATRVSEHGEWKQDHNGTLLPNWLADMIGPDCMSEVTDITGSIEEIQALPLSQMRLPLVRWVDLTRSGDESLLSPSLIDRLNELKLDRVGVTLSRLTEEDVQVLARLHQPIHLRIQKFDDQTADFSNVESIRSITLVGRRITESQIDQLASLAKTEYVEWDGISLSPKLIRRWRDSVGKRRVRLSLSNTRISHATLEALLELPSEMTYFRQGTQIVRNKYQLWGTRVSNYQPSRISPDIDVEIKRQLELPSVKLTIEEVAELVNWFRCDALLLRRVLSAQEVDRLWQCPTLQLIETIDETGWKSHVRLPD